jgi:ribosomal protein L35AE/L33A
VSITLFKTTTADRVLKAVNRIIPDQSQGQKHRGQQVEFRNILVKITSVNDPEDGFYIGSEVIFNKSSKTWVTLTEGIKDLPLYETSGSKSGKIGDIVRATIEPALDENDEIEDNFIGLFTFGGKQEGGFGCKVVIVSGMGQDYLVTVHTGFPFNDTGENQFSGTLELLYTVEEDLIIGSELFATCFLNPNYDADTDLPEDQYKCYVYETIYTLI